MDGFINVLKPTGLSSHDVVDIVRRIFKQKRVGHVGTLDPAAAGVLPVALGRAARLVEYMEGADKSYRAEIAFGYATVMSSHPPRTLSSLRRRSCTPYSCALSGRSGRRRPRIQRSRLAVSVPMILCGRGQRWR